MGGMWRLGPGGKLVLFSFPLCAGGLDGGLVLLRLMNRQALGLGGCTVFCYFFELAQSFAAGTVS